MFHAVISLFVELAGKSVHVACTACYNSLPVLHGYCGMFSHLHAWLWPRQSTLAGIHALYLILVWNHYLDNIKYNVWPKCIVTRGVCNKSHTMWECAHARALRADFLIIHAIFLTETCYYRLASAAHAIALAYAAQQPAMASWFHLTRCLATKTIRLPTACHSGLHSKNSSHFSRTSTYISPNIQWNYNNACINDVQQAKCAARVRIQCFTRCTCVAYMLGIESE